MDTEGQNYRRDPLFVPFRVLQNKNLRFSQRIILAWFMQYGPCKADYETLCLVCGARERSVKDNVRDLERRGYIGVTSDDGRGKVYDVTRKGWGVE